MILCYCSAACGADCERCEEDTLACTDCASGYYNNEDVCGGKPTVALECTMKMTESVQCIVYSSYAVSLTHYTTT